MKLICRWRSCRVLPPPLRPRRRSWRQRPPRSPPCGACWPSDTHTHTHLTSVTYDNLLHTYTCYTIPMDDDIHFKYVLDKGFYVKIRLRCQPLICHMKYRVPQTLVPVNVKRCIVKTSYETRTLKFAHIHHFQPYVFCHVCVDKIIWSQNAWKVTWRDGHTHHVARLVAGRVWTNK